MQMCLIIEKQSMVALDLELCCVEEGYEIAGPFTTCKQGFEWLAHHTPDLAIIGSEAFDGSCAQLADELRHRKVPTVVHSDDALAIQNVPEFLDMPWLPNPFLPVDLTAAIAQTLRNQ
jgi:DNA-binding response OmpR family regulator